MLTWPTSQLMDAPALRQESEQERATLSFEVVYRTWFGDVARWVRARGANEADIEDLTQEVFIIVRRKLGSFDGRNLAGFLYRITERTVRDHRRSAWIRNILRRPANVPELEAPHADSLQALQEREKRRALDRILARMSEKRRTTFVLFEIEGYSGEEIAHIQSIPVETVWTRLHHARKDFLRFVGELPSSERDA